MCVCFLVCCLIGCFFGFVRSRREGGGGGEEAGLLPGGGVWHQIITITCSYVLFICPRTPLVGCARWRSASPPPRG